MLQDEEVECFVGYTDDGVRLVENVNFTHCVSEDCMTLTQEHLLDYARNILHTEEKPSVLFDTSVKYNPRALEKQINVYNIEYKLDGNCDRRDNEFMLNVTSDLMTLVLTTQIHYRSQGKSGLRPPSQATDAWT